MTLGRYGPPRARDSSGRSTFRRPACMGFQMKTTLVIDDIVL
jgi:hypothetical protein